MVPAEGGLSVRGVVRAVGGERLDVETATGIAPARRAAGCLLEPQVGDVVVLEMAEGGWVTAVLERGSREPARIEAAELTFAGRHVRFSGERVCIASEGTTTLAASRAYLSAREAPWAVDALDLKGDAAEVDACAADVAAATSDGLFERLITRVSSAVRRVLDIDRLRGAEVDLAAREAASLRGRAAVIRAYETVAVEGGPVQFG